MEVRSVRRDQICLCEDQDEPCRQHDAMYMEISWNWRDIELAAQKKRLREANKDPGQ